MTTATTFTPLQFAAEIEAKLKPHQIRVDGFTWRYGRDVEMVLKRGNESLDHRLDWFQVEESFNQSFWLDVKVNAIVEAFTKAHSLVR